MYKEKGLIKVFNGKKYKYVSYLNEGNNIIFTTGNNTKKYGEITKTNKIKVMINGKTKEYDITLIERKEEVDLIFKKLKDTKAIPPFIPRKNKIIVQYKI